MLKICSRSICLEIWNIQNKKSRCEAGLVVRLAAYAAPIYWCIVVRYRSRAKQQYAENRFKNAKQIKRRLVVVFVNVHLTVGMLNSFVFHIGWYFVNEKRKLIISVDKLKLFGNNFYF